MADADSGSELLQTENSGSRICLWMNDCACAVHPPEKKKQEEKASGNGDKANMEIKIKRPSVIEFRLIRGIRYY